MNCGKIKDPKYHVFTILLGYNVLFLTHMIVWENLNP